MLLFRQKNACRFAVLTTLGEKRMRTIIIAITLVLFLIVTLPFYLIVTLIGFANKKACARISQGVVNALFKFVLFEAGAKMTVLGQENIPEGIPVLFAGNHRSYADIPMGYLTSKKTVGFIAKKEIKKIPILSWWMKNMTCLFLDRDDPRQGLKTILAAVENVKQGFSVFIMPEGTRNHEADMLPFKDGSFKVAEKAECPIVPVAFSNTDSLYELHRPWVHGARVVIHYGKPVETKGMTRDDKKTLASRVQNSIAEMLAEDKKYL